MASLVRGFDPSQWVIAFLGLSISNDPRLAEMPIETSTGGRGGRLVVMVPRGPGLAVALCEGRRPPAPTAVGFVAG
jgi:hypothetical protein